MSASGARPRVLSIAGSDPSGGAGIQADLKSIAAFDGYGMAAITTLTVQNTLGVREVHAPPPDFLRAQLNALSDDIVIDAVKIGMLHSVELVAVVAEWLERIQPPVVVLDPVMVSTSGHRLLEPAAEDSVRDLCDHADLVTPNLEELAVLVGQPVVRSWAEALGQGRAFASSIDGRVLVKGGHLRDGTAPDALVTADTTHEVGGRRVDTPHTHGTGCSLSSALATLRAGGASWEESLTRAKVWLTGALESAASLRLGHGSGPIDHLHHLRVPDDWAGDAWRACAGARASVDEVPFVRELASGKLPGDEFDHYLRQDALYLAEYARVLARVSALAPAGDEQEYWARSAVGALSEVERLHLEHIDPGRAEPSLTTLGYTGHLHRSASVGSYAEAVAAVLPCFVLYTDLGRRFAAIPRGGHAYADWLEAYVAPEFAAASAEAERIASGVAARVGAAERLLMADAYRTSMEWERAFFAQTRAEG